MSQYEQQRVQERTTAHIMFYYMPRLRGFGKLPRFVNSVYVVGVSIQGSEVYRMVSDVRFSGSTCTSIITYGRRVYCANVGDSRTILIR